jgi:hypothetical protein
MQLVYEDAILNGIVTLNEMYSSAIEFRATRDGMINELDKRVVSERKPVRREATELGEPSEPAYSASATEFESGPTENGSGHVDVERGLGTADEADIESDLSYEREP